MANIRSAIYIIIALSLTSCGAVKNTTNNFDDVYTTASDYKKVQLLQVAREQEKYKKEQEKQAAYAAANQQQSAGAPNGVSNVPSANTNQNSNCACNNIYPGYSIYGFNSGYGMYNPYYNNYNMMSSGYGYNPYYGYSNYTNYSPYHYNYYPSNYNNYNSYANNGGYTTTNTQPKAAPQHRGTPASVPGQNAGVGATFNKPGAAVQTNTAPSPGNIQAHNRINFNQPNQTSYYPATQQNNTPTLQTNGPSGGYTQPSTTPSARPTYNTQPAQVTTSPTPSYQQHSNATPGNQPSFNSPTPRSGNGGFGGASHTGGGSAGGSHIGGGGSSSGGGGRHR